MLLLEASVEKIARQDIKLIMRVISNVATVGVDVKSQSIYKLNPYLSKKAKYALETCKSFEDWVGDKKKNLNRRVTNEHQYPLQEFWKDIQKNINSYNSEIIWNKFCEFPMISILVEEDAELQKKKYKNLAPTHRYLEAGIEIVKLNTSAYNYWSALHLKNPRRSNFCVEEGKDQ